MGRGSSRRWWSSWRVGVLVVAVTAAVAAPAAAVSSGPSSARDFPDPFVLPVTTSSSTTYYAYSTGSAGRNLQVMTSPDLVTWSSPGDPLPVLPPWASAGNTWAPGVLARTGGYVMYYTVRDTRSGRQCISTAVGTSPSTFVDGSTAPLVCQLSRGGSIDPTPFVAPDGTAYLLWKSDDNALGQPTALWSQRLTSDGRALAGSGPSLLLRASSWTWQRGVIEGPSMLSANGAYYLFYGAGDWSSSAAGIGYATCASPLGSCTNRSGLGPWLATHGAAVGPSGPAVFTARSGTTTTTKIAYHAWQDGIVGYPAGMRDLWLDDVSFASGAPVVR